MVASALDVDTLRERIADVVALVGVLEADTHPRRLARDDVERDPDRRALPEARAKVGVEAGSGADRGDKPCRVARDRKAVDPPVPRVGLRKDRAARRAGEPQRVGRAAGADEREDGDGSRGGAGVHGLSIGKDMSVSDPSVQAPEDLLPAASLAANSARVRDGTVPEV